MHERGLALPGPPLDGVVPPLRDVDLAARARPASTRTAPTRRSSSASRCSTATASRSSSGRRRRGRCRRTSRPPCSPTPSTACATNGDWVAVARYPDEHVRRSVVRGAELVGCRYEGPFDTLAPRRGRRAPRHPVGRGHRSTRAPASSTSRPGCGAEDFELSRVHDLPVLTPVDESGRFYDEYGWLHGLSTGEAADQIVGDLARARAARRTPATIEHRYPALLALPHAAHLPHHRRLVHLGRRAPPAAARRERDASSGRPSTWASAWTTGSGTWATGTSRGAATTACRSRSTPARAAT